MSPVGDVDSLFADSDITFDHVKQVGQEIFTYPNIEGSVIVQIGQRKVIKLNSS